MDGHLVDQQFYACSSPMKGPFPEKKLAEWRDSERIFALLAIQMFVTVNPHRLRVLHVDVKVVPTKFWIRTRTAILAAQESNTCKVMKAACTWKKTPVDLLPKNEQCVRGAIQTRASNSDAIAFTFLP